MTAKIYLDFNSTHPPDTAALAAGRDFYLANFANSSGLSLASQIVNKRIEEAREEIAGILSISAKQIIFTSCATESNNLLIREFHRRHEAQPFRVLSSPFEHPSITECLKALPETQITWLTANPDGTVNTPALKEHLQQSYDLITMMAVQNESGVLLPVQELIRSGAADRTKVLVDFSQALPKLAGDAPDTLNLRSASELARGGIYLTATGHKVGAGFGAGLIITPPGHADLKSAPLLAGGNQEYGLRAGSHNTEAIINLAGALQRKLVSNSFIKWQALTEQFAAQLSGAIALIVHARIVSEHAERAPGTILLFLPGVAIDFLIMALDREGITVSTGTSCKSRSRSPSAALLSMGFSEADALSVIRISFDQNLSTADMSRTAEVLAQSLISLA